MADETEKFIAKLTPVEQKALAVVIRRIDENNLRGLDVKKLVGSNNTFRVKKGSFRVIFTRIPGRDNDIVLVGRRNENTYRDF